MIEDHNVQLIKTAYSAFGQGDVQALVKAVSDDIEFRPLMPQSIWPFAGPRQGREQFIKFLEGFSEIATIERFEPLEFIAQGERVAVLLSERSRIKATGLFIDQTYVHVFTVANNQIVRFAIFGDSAPVLAALQRVQTQ
jgi:ketosteroid isomerase-like protein